jgi:hypothetical protein
LFFKKKIIPVNVASRMDSTGEIWKIQVPEPTANLLREKGYTCVPRGEVHVKGKGIMFTYWVLGKNESGSRLTSPTILPAGIPMTRSPTQTSLTRQTSSHSSLAAVVFGIMQVTQQNGPSARKSLHFVINRLCQIYLISIITKVIIIIIIIN